jgi:hypothetical protein
MMKFAEYRVRIASSNDNAAHTIDNANRLSIPLA